MKNKSEEKTERKRIKMKLGQMESGQVESGQIYRGRKLGKGKGSEMKCS